MADSSLPVIKAVIAALKASPALSGLIEARVFSDVPQGAAFPYCVVSCSSTPFAGQDFSGQTHNVRVQSFSRRPSAQECLAAQGAVFAALDRKEQSLTLDSGQPVYCHFLMSDRPFQEDDGKTWQSVIEFDLTIV